MFGNNSQNARCRQFTFKGLKKVHFEWGLLSMALNLRNCGRRSSATST
ncbi:MAG: hypothetical protein JXD23_11020 [Spirochaetales bacterium]|nr:hypothetical protein [Spirochaetales bacterium]